MEIYIIIMLFIYGCVLGSFYGVVGERLANGKSIIKPPSSCTFCGKRLKWYELIPIFSFFIQKGRCNNCHEKLSLFYPFIEFLTGILFVISYFIFDFSYSFYISIFISSYLVIVIVSDIKYYVIPDEVTIFISLLLLIFNYFAYGYNYFISHLISSFSLFIFMYLLSFIGKIIFKKECLGGGDIKLMFVIGLFLNTYNGLFSVFLASALALPLSLYLVYKKKDSMVAFGPFLIIASLIIYFTGFDIVTFLSNLYN